MKILCVLTLAIMLLQCGAVTAEDSQALQPASPSIRVDLKLERNEFFLGESIAVKYFMKNEGDKPARYANGGFYPTLRLTKQFRPIAFKIEEPGKPLGDPVPNWPMPMDFGGAFEINGPNLQPGESRSTTYLSLAPFGLSNPAHTCCALRTGIRMTRLSIRSERRRSSCGNPRRRRHAAFTRR